MTEEMNEDRKRDLGMRETLSTFREQPMRMVAV